MNNSTYKLIVTLLVLVIVIGGGVLLYRNLGQNIDLGEAIPTETVASNPAPDFTVTDAAGNEVKLSDFRGKGVVLNFWASWCGPCKSEMPAFQKVYEELGTDVHFVMVNVGEHMDAANEFLASTDYTFPVYYDVNNDASYAYQIGSIPTTFFIDAEGNLVTYQIGAMAESTLRASIDAIR